MHICDQRRCVKGNGSGQNMLDFTLNSNTVNQPKIFFNFALELIKINLNQARYFP